MQQAARPCALSTWGWTAGAGCVPTAPCQCQGNMQHEGSIVPCVPISTRCMAGSKHRIAGRLPAARTLLATMAASATGSAAVPASAAAVAFPGFVIPAAASSSLGGSGCDATGVSAGSAQAMVHTFLMILHHSQNLMSVSTITRQGPRRSATIERQFLRLPQPRGTCHWDWACDRRRRPRAPRAPAPPHAAAPAAAPCAPRPSAAAPRCRETVKVCIVTFACLA